MRHHPGGVQSSHRHSTHPQCLGFIAASESREPGWRDTLRGIHDASCRQQQCVENTKTVPNGAKPGLWQHDKDGGFNPEKRISLSGSHSVFREVARTITPRSHNCGREVEVSHAKGWSWRRSAVYMISPSRERRRRATHPGRERRISRVRKARRRSILVQPSSRIAQVWQSVLSPRRRFETAQLNNWPVLAFLARWLPGRASLRSGTQHLRWNQAGQTVTASGVGLWRPSL